LFESPGGRRQVNGLEGEGSSERFVERVFKLKADVFICGNGKVIGNVKDNWVVGRKVGK